MPRVIDPRELAIYGWREFGKCKLIDPNVMDCDVSSTTDEGSTRRSRVRTAKRVCAQCPVIEQCKAHAIKEKEPSGVWGGLTAHERNRVRNGAKATTCRRCKLLRVGRWCEWCHGVKIDRSKGGAAPSVLDGHEDRLIELVGARLSDRVVAEMLSEELDAEVTRSMVAAARRKAGIDSCVVNASNGPEKQTRFDRSQVDMCMSTGDGFADLSVPEQTELLRLWLRNSSKSRFLKQFHCSWRVMAKLRDRLEAIS